MKGRMHAYDNGMGCIVEEGEGVGFRNSNNNSCYDTLVLLKYFNKYCTFHVRCSSVESDSLSKTSSDFQLASKL